MNTINKNISNNPKSIIKNNNSLIYSLNTKNMNKAIKLIKENKEGKALNLFDKIKNLNLQSSVVSSQSIGTVQKINFIKSQKLNKLEITNNTWEGVQQPSNLHPTKLTFSDLILGTRLVSSGSKLTQIQPLNSITSTLIEENPKALAKIGTQYKQISSPKGETSGFFLSYNSGKNILPQLSNALIALNEGNIKGQISYPNYVEFGFRDKNKKANAYKYKIRHYLNLLSKFEFKLPTSYYDYYQFNKSNYYLFAMEKAAGFLRLAFLVKGCLISKPIFNIVYPKFHNHTEENEFKLSKPKNTNSNKAKIIIHLFYYIKTKGLLNNNSTSDKQNSNQSNLKNVDKSNISTVFKSENLNVKAATVFSGQGQNKFITSVYDDKFLNLCDYLNKLFNAEIEFDLVRLYQPYQNSDILVQYLNSQSYNKKFIKIVSSLFRSINIYKKNNFNLPSIQGLKVNNFGKTSLLNESISYPSGVSGINIKLAGRPNNERIIPRITVKRAQRGNFNRLNAKMIEKSMYTDKTRKGAFNFTVSLSHIFK